MAGNITSVILNQQQVKLPDIKLPQQNIVPGLPVQALPKVPDLKPQLPHVQASHITVHRFSKKANIPVSLPISFQKGSLKLDRMLSPEAKQKAMIEHAESMFAQVKMAIGDFAQKMTEFFNNFGPATPALFATDAIAGITSAIGTQNAFTAPLKDVDHIDFDNRVNNSNSQEVFREEKYQNGAIFPEEKDPLHRYSFEVDKSESFTAKYNSDDKLVSLVNDKNGRFKFKVSYENNEIKQYEYFHSNGTQDFYFKTQSGIIDLMYAKPEIVEKFKKLSSAELEYLSRPENKEILSDYYEKLLNPEKVLREEKYQNGEMFPKEKDPLQRYAFSSARNRSFTAKYNGIDQLISVTQDETGEFVLKVSYENNEVKQYEYFHSNGTQDFYFKTQSGVIDLRYAKPETIEEFKKFSSAELEFLSRPENKEILNNYYEKLLNKVNQPKLKIETEELKDGSKLVKSLEDHVIKINMVGKETDKGECFNFEIKAGESYKFDSSGKIISIEHLDGTETTFDYSDNELINATYTDKQGNIFRKFSNGGTYTEMKTPNGYYGTSRNPDGSVYHVNINNNGNHFIFNKIDKGTFNYNANIGDVISVELLNISAEEVKKLNGVYTLEGLTAYFKNININVYDKHLGNRYISIGEAVASSNYSDNPDVIKHAKMVIEQLLPNKKAYLKLIQAFHPDRNPNVDSTLMLFINQLKAIKDKLDAGLENNDYNGFAQENNGASYNQNRYNTKEERIKWKNPNTQEDLYMTRAQLYELLNLSDLQQNILFKYLGNTLELLTPAQLKTLSQFEDRNLLFLVKELKGIESLSASELEKLSSYNFEELFDYIKSKGF